jgi:DNA-binding CsgD family transcriptional regulator
MDWKAKLSSREVEIVQYVVRGRTNREIANDTGLREHTINAYLFRIFDKLGVSNRVELALFVTGFLGGPDTAGIPVRKPEGPKVNSGAAAAPLDEPPESDTADDLQVPPSLTNRLGNRYFRGGAPSRVAASLLFSSGNRI